MLFLDFDLEKSCVQQKFIEASSDVSVSNDQNNCPAKLNGCHQPNGSFDNYQQSSTTLQGCIRLKPSGAHHYKAPTQASGYAQQPHTYSYMKGKLLFNYLLKTNNIFADNYYLLFLDPNLEIQYNLKQQNCVQQKVADASFDALVLNDFMNAEYGNFIEQKEVEGNKMKKRRLVLIKYKTKHYPKNKKSLNFKLIKYLTNLIAKLFLN